MNEQIDSTPKRGFLRLPQILGDPKAQPPIPARIPVSRSTWYSGIRQGLYPAPVRLSKRTSAWPLALIDALCDQLAAQQKEDL
ncbi:MAG: transcriptional regulator [Desulfobacteraceae bacterium]|nr:MAG: transcriptional regulator [Desulfobacteraceae bacterium]